jgi:hypothetical protein
MLNADFDWAGLGNACLYFLSWDPERNLKPIRVRGGACALIAAALKNLFGPSKNFGCLIPESILKTILKPTSNQIQRYVDLIPKQNDSV